MHKLGKEAWVAGSIRKDQLAYLVKIEVDVICVRKAACEELDGHGRFGEVKKDIVRELIIELSNHKSRARHTTK